ncbi:MAG TPA: NADP-dependent oxidoreductase [Solirubrobacteraceae bacterium]|nr:NADP-dependent oxidoreductase [Solirubrobacteraceae bacterium]
MQAITVAQEGAAPAPQDVDEARAPGAGEVLVRVQASSVNPLDGGVAAGMLSQMGLPHEYPVTLGRDFAGVIEQVGEGVTSVAAGDEVFGELSAFVPPVHAGTWAERIVVGEDSLAKKPAGVDTAQAGAAPLVTLTALATVDALELSAGQTVLVVGATGGVGSIVVQLAKAAGATVIAPGLPEDEEFLRGLGVDEVVPRDGDLVAAVRERHPDGVHALVDAVTSMQPTPYDGALADGGRVASPTNAAGEGPGRTDVMHAAILNRASLERVGALLADGTVKVPIQQTFELTRAHEALAALGAGHTQGKIALRAA